MVRAPPRAGMFSLYFAAFPSLWASDGGLGETHRAYLYTFSIVKIGLKMSKPGRNYYINEFGIKRSAILCRLTYPKSSLREFGQKKL